MSLCPNTSLSPRVFRNMSLCPNQRQITEQINAKLPNFQKKKPNHRTNRCQITEKISAKLPNS